MRTLCLFFSFLLLLIAACGGENERKGSAAAASTKEPSPLLDLREGSFGGVALGDTVQELHRIFGESDPGKEGEPATALSIGSEEEDYSPQVLPGSGFYRYEQVVFMVSGARIVAIIVNDPKARASDGGVGTGDDLPQAGDRYRLRCGTANENSEYEPFPACVGRTAPRVYVWFGANPIRNITLSRARPHGV